MCNKPSLVVELFSKQLLHPWWRWPVLQGRWAERRCSSWMMSSKCDVTHCWWCRQSSCSLNDVSAAASRMWSPAMDCDVSSNALLLGFSCQVRKLFFARVRCSLQLGDRKAIWTVKSWVLVCWWWRLTGALHVFLLQLSPPPPPPPSSLAPIKSRMEKFFYGLN